MAKNICKNCNNVIPVGTTFCLFCGQEQDIGESLNNQRAKKRRQHNVPVVEVGTESVPVEVKKDDNINGQVTKDETPIENQNTKSQNSAKEQISAPTQNKREISDDNASVDSNTNVPEEKEIEQKPGETEEKNQPVDEELSEDKTDSEELDGEEISSKPKRKKNKKELEYELYHDSLTGLLNEKAYKKKIESVSKTELCIISVDANNLKMINDTMGHKYGDRLLQIIAECLKKTFGDNCYRLHGDEFMVILVGIKKQVIVDKVEVFKKLLQQEENNLIEPMVVQAAVGIAYNDDMHSISELVEIADKEMYQNKRALKEIYNPNYDGYYDDVKAEYEEYKKELDKENIKKIVLTIVIAILAIIATIVFM